MVKETECVFCQIVAGLAPAEIVFQNESFLAIKNKYPQAPVHILVIPKKHVSKKKLVSSPQGGFWDDLMKVVFEVVRQTGLHKTGYKLVNNGAGYNHFDHEHMHILGGTKTEPGGQT